MREIGSRRDGRLLLALALALLHSPAAAASDAGHPGDVATTDQRLQRAGLNPAFRLRIHGAVQKGADWLASRQLGDGTFRRAAPLTAEFGDDPAAVEGACALALACAGGKGHREAALRTLAWMAPPGGRIRAEVTARTRAAAMASLLAREVGADPALSQALADALAGAQDPKGGLWSSSPGEAAAFGTIPRQGPAKRVPDLPGTRDALLGLAAAAAAGASIPPAVPRRALEALVDGPDDGSLLATVATVMPLPAARSGQRLAALQAARDLVARTAILPPAEARDSDRALAAARRLLGDEALDGLWARGKPFLFAAAPPAWCWDVSAGAILAGMDSFDGEPWAPALAEAVLARQGGEGTWMRPTGSYDGDELVDTALAILVLVRAAEPLAREVPPAAPPPATGPWPDPGAVPPAERVPLDAAEEALAWLEGLVRDPAARDGEVLRFLLFAGKAYERLAPGAEPKASDDWHRRAEEAFVRAAVLEREAPARANDFAAVNLAAARLLGHARSRAAAPFRRALEREFGRDRRTDLPREFLRAAFESLVRVDRDGTLPWLVGPEVLSSGIEEPERRRVQEALRAAASCGRAPGEKRRDACERICGVFEGVEGATLGFTITWRPAKPVARAAERWFPYRRFAIEALWTLCTDPASGRPPLGNQQEYLLTVMQYRPWLREHRDLSKAPWSNR
jgi:hypothetical protein